jgi:hypothetical protein
MDFDLTAAKKDDVLMLLVDFLVLATFLSLALLFPFTKNKYCDAVCVVTVFLEQTSKVEQRRLRVLCASLCCGVSVAATKK